MYELYDKYINSDVPWNLKENIVNDQRDSLNTSCFENVYFEIYSINPCPFNSLVKVLRPFSKSNRSSKTSVISDVQDLK